MAVLKVAMTVVRTVLKMGGIMVVRMAALTVAMRAVAMVVWKVGRTVAMALTTAGIMVAMRAALTVAMRAVAMVVWKVGRTVAMVPKMVGLKAAAWARLDKPSRCTNKAIVTF